MDQVFGEPFRAGGAISTALYNASFAGMQAYSSAELSGATKEKAREAAAQHWTAEGLKPGGVIDMGLSHLQEMQKDQNAKNPRKISQNSEPVALASKSVKIRAPNYL